MKYLIPTNECTPQKGGIARYIQAIQDCFDSADILHFQEGFPTRLHLLKKLFKATKEYDHILVHHIYPVGFACFLLSFIGRNYSIYFHGMDWQIAKKRFFTKWILKRADRVIANSEFVVSDIFRQYQVDAKLLYPVLPKSIEHKERKSKRTGNKILSVSRLVKRKGHESIISLLKYVPEAEYTIAGDGPYRASLEQLAKQLHVNSRVHFLGNVDDAQLETLYNTHDVFALPIQESKHDVEGFGIGYLEAAWFELPVLATNVIGVNEAVVHEQTGLLANNMIELQEMLIRLMKDPVLRNQLGTAGRKRVEQQFLTTDFCKTLHKIYD